MNTLILISAFFSGSEIAYASASKPRLISEAEAGDKRAKRATDIVDNYVKAIATILVGNNLVNIAATSVITLLCVEYYIPQDPNNTLIAEIIATVVLLIFGEILPKIYCQEHANRLVLSFSGLMQGAMRFFLPITFLVSKFVEKLSVQIGREHF